MDHKAAEGKDLVTVFRAMPPTSASLCRRHFSADSAIQSSVIFASVRDTEVPECEQVLSLRAPWAGQEHYFLSDRKITVSPNNYVILNHGQRYASATSRDMTTGVFRIFFSPDIVRETFAARRTAIDDALDGADRDTTRLVEFPSCLRPNDNIVSPLVRSFESNLAGGRLDSSAYLERLLELLAALFSVRELSEQSCNRLAAKRLSTRREVYRRIRMATDAIQSAYRLQWTLDELASISCLSKYHFLRSFKEIEGETPLTFLRRTRVDVARSLLSTTNLPISEISQQVGFANPSSLFRAYKDLYQQSPGRLRRTEKNRLGV